MATKPGRFDGGVQMSTGTAAWNGSTGVGGLYYKTGVGLVMRKTDNSEVTLGAGGAGGTLATTYSSGASTADSILSLDSTRGKLLLKDNAAPIGTLFEIQSSGGTSYYLWNASNMTFGVNRGIATSAGNATFDFSNATGIFKTSTGSHTFGSAVWATPANLAITSAASATNTTGMSLTPNVADGASSIALDVNCATTLVTSGSKLLRFRNNGTTLFTLDNTAFAYPIWQAGGTTLGLMTTGVSGMKADDSNGVDIFTGSIPRVNVTGTGLVPSADITYSSGSAAARWSNVFSARYTTLTQTVAAAASLTLNPANGAHVRITLSATAITSLTVSAGGAGERLVVEVIQDGTGSRTIPTTWTNVVFPGGTYTATTAANKRDKITLDYDATDSKWYATVTANL
jgi:hypothetical protein